MIYDNVSEIAKKKKLTKGNNNIICNCWNINFNLKLLFIVLILFILCIEKRKIDLLIILLLNHRNYG